MDREEAELLRAQEEAMAQMRGERLRMGQGQEELEVEHFEDAREHPPHAEGAAAANDRGAVELPEDRLGRLLELLAMGQAQQTEILRQQAAGAGVPEQPRLKVPEFDGTGDVELFLQQFHDVADASRWEPMVRLLKLKEALTGKARDCVQPATFAGVTDALRTRFGLTVRQARAGLEGLYRDPRTNLSDHALEVDRLIRGAFPTLRDADRNSMAVDKFVASVNHVTLRNYLLA